MKPAPFDYEAPRSVDDAVALLARHRDRRPMVLAGGQTLVPLMNYRQVRPGVLVDLQHIERLSELSVTDGDLHVGAMVRQQVAFDSADVRRTVPLLVEGISHVSQPPVRNSGTVGGSVAHADPGSEIPAVCVALDAVMTVAGPEGTREVGAADFFTGPFTTAIAAGEILVSIRIPHRPGAHAFVEFRRTHLAHAVVGAAVLLDVGADGVVGAARAALCGVGATPVRATATEEALVGIEPDRASIDAAVEATVAGLTPAGNQHAGGETRVDIARTYLRRGIELALDRARNGG